MSAIILSEHANARIYHATWRDLLNVVPECDHLITDTPYSEETHSGHAEGAQTANRAMDWANREHKAGRVDKRTGASREKQDRNYEACLKLAANGKGERRKINYPPWTPEDVQVFVSAWSPRVRGWFVAMTDHVLGPVWEAALRRQGRYTFSPLAYVAPGSRVRMVGDGPAQWSCWIVVGEAAEQIADRVIVARPRTAEAAAWRALRGAYVLPKGCSEDMDVVGGKPAWLGEALTEDYSNEGDLVVDPCCGAGTFTRAAQRMGRRAIGGDQMEAHARIAAERISQPFSRMLF